jgi:hypothetical protein
VEEREALFEAFDECLDLADQLTELLDAGGSLTSDQAACVAERYVASDEFREATVSGDYDEELNRRIDAVLADATEGCVGGAGSPG